MVREKDTEQRTSGSNLLLLSCCHRSHPASAPVSLKAQSALSARLVPSTGPEALGAVVRGWKK